MAGATTKEASSSTFQCSYYDVFLSFRGPDTRNTFIGHLYKALVDAGINTFKDDHGIERGEKIESELQEAIRDSKISLIVFSENYASSRWCLDEVVQILQHKNTNIILPIFYHVNPSHVRNQRGSFANAFAKHQDKLEEATVERWKAALREVADLAGMEIKKHEDESKFVQKIVEEVSNKLLSVAPYTEKQVGMLEKRLRFFNRFRNDAEIKQYKDESVKEWLDELKDVVYDAEDVIDDIATEALSKKLKSVDQSKTISSSELENGETITKIKEITQGSDEVVNVCDAEDVIDNVATEARSKKLMSEDQCQTISSFLPSFSSNPLSKIKNGKTIREIAQRFDKLKQDMSNLDLKHVALGSSSSSSTTTSVSSRETTSLMDESPVGRDGDKDKIIDLLLVPKESAIGEELSVIPIVGMGGLGKTTLAQMVYNDNDRLKDKDQFSPKAWVCVSNEFDVKRITKDILESVTPGPDWSKFNNLDQLQNKLKEALNGKKFLIVLDDVWDNSNFDWGLLRKPFRVGATGSAIIVTTRDGKIASTMGTVDNHDLQSLSPDDCWSVFAHHAFRKTSVGANPNLVKIGKEIVSKCKGLPLAAKSLGGLLCSKEEEFEWKNVLNSEIWEREEENGILLVLILSYYYLKSHLKRCFAYCSIFPKDYEFKEEKVVSLWMAEGFLEQPEGKMNMEDFGRICFRELLSRSFFQPSSNNNGLFVMHDLMSDLAQWVAGKTCFRLDNSSDISKISHKARHSSYNRSIYDSDDDDRVGYVGDKFKVFNEVGYLRTFLDLNASYITDNVLSDLLTKLKFLRVLKLRGYNYNISELPSSISDQKHLRYLDLSKTGIESLPDSVTTLCNLQTLLLTNCLRLKKLPEEMGNLINLRHLDISNSSRIKWMPPQLGRLTSLRELSDFVVSKDRGSGIGELKNLKHLNGKLRISKLENVIIDAQQAWEANILSDKEGLNVLNMEWSYNEGRNEKVEKDVLEMLRPHEKLKKLTIRWYGGVSFPSWLGDPSFSNMVLLELIDCKRCTALPPLGTLKKLKDLRIKGFYEVDKVGIEFYGKGCSNHFPSLETLGFKDMKKWKHWFSCEIDKQGEVFPRLRELYIEECPELLGSLPDHLPSLEILWVKNCTALTSIVHAISWHNCSKKLMIDNCASLQYLMDEDDASSASPSTSMMTQDINNRRRYLLEDLSIYDCPSLTSLSSLSRGELPTTLKSLNISRCRKLESIGERLLDNTSLNSINISYCENLKTLPEGLRYLRDLSIMACPNLFSLKFGKEMPARLERLQISECSKLESIGESFHNNTPLEEIMIYSCENLKSLPENLHILPRLSVIHLCNCPRIKSFPKEGFPTNITSLQLKELNIPYQLVNWGLHRLASLRKLYIKGGCSVSAFAVVSFPADEEFEMVLPSSLVGLVIGNFPNLESLSSNGFQNLSSLKELTINYCPKLRSLPKKGLFPSLFKLDISTCPLLVQRCEKDGGPEWPKISHVPQVILYETEDESSSQWSP